MRLHFKALANGNAQGRRFISIAGDGRAALASGVELRVADQEGSAEPDIFLGSRGVVNGTIDMI